MSHTLATAGAVLRIAIEMFNARRVASRHGALRSGTSLSMLKRENIAFSFSFSLSHTCHAHTHITHNKSN